MAPRRAQDPPRRAQDPQDGPQDVPKTPPRRAKTRPIPPKTPKTGPKPFQDDHWRPQDAKKLNPNAHNTPAKGPKTSKTLPRGVLNDRRTTGGPKMSTRRLPKAPRRSEGLPNSPQEIPQRPQHSSKRLPRRPQNQISRIESLLCLGKLGDPRALPRGMARMGFPMQSHEALGSPRPRIPRGSYPWGPHGTPLGSQGGKIHGYP